MLKKMLGTILGILILVLGIVCYVKLQTPATGEKVDGYLLSTSGGTYCGGTKTGSIALRIETTGSGYQKMFVTSDDVTKNGDKKIVDGRYLLRVYRGDHQLPGAVCETDSLHDHQELRVYFTTVDNPSPSQDIEIVISENSEENVVARIKCALKNDSSLAEFGTVDGNALARISSSGVCLDLSDPSFSRPDFQSVGSLSLKTSSNTVTVALNNRVEPQTAAEHDIIFPPVCSQSSENKGSYAYALDLDGWQDIESLTLKSAAAGITLMVRKDLLDDLQYVSGSVVYQEDGVISITDDNMLYKAPLPESQKDTIFDIGTSVDIFYGDKIKQDYGYDLVDVTAVTG